MKNWPLNTVEFDSAKNLLDKEILTDIIKSVKECTALKDHTVSYFPLARNFFDRSVEELFDSMSATIHSPWHVSPTPGNEWMVTLYATIGPNIRFVIELQYKPVADEVPVRTYIVAHGKVDLSNCPQGTFTPTPKEGVTNAETAPQMDTAPQETGAVNPNTSVEEHAGKSLPEAMYYLLQRGMNFQSFVTNLSLALDAAERKHLASACIFPETKSFYHNRKALENMNASAVEWKEGEATINFDYYINHDDRLRITMKFVSPSNGKLARVHNIVIFVMDKDGVVENHSVMHLPSAEHMSRFTLSDSVVPVISHFLINVKDYYREWSTNNPDNPMPWKKHGLTEKQWGEVECYRNSVDQYLDIFLSLGNAMPCAVKTKAKEAILGEAVAKYIEMKKLRKA